jgi:diguanylate cyclase (GGDEF)-like protein
MAAQRVGKAPRTTEAEIAAVGAEPHLLRSLVDLLLPWRAADGHRSQDTAPKIWAFGVFAGLLVAVAITDHLIGTQYSLLFLYGVPVVWASWNLGTAAGLSLAVLGAVAWILADRNLDNPVAWWNATVRFGLLATLGYVVSLQRALRAALRRATRLARTDALTGVLNGRAFAVLAAREIDRMQRTRKPLSLAYLDLDDFKQINDSGGHLAGDTALRAVAKALTASVRRVDLVARMGGDEFAVLLPETSDAAAMEVLQRFRLHLAATSSAAALAVTASVGLVTWTRPPSSLDAMIRVADAQMYAAKSDGKNNIRSAAVSVGPSEDGMSVPRERLNQDPPLN